MARSRNNVLAGGLVVLSVAGAVVIVSLLGGLMDTFGRVTRVVKFSLADGVNGLKQGAEVKVGGLKVGAVSSVYPVFAPGGSIEHHEVKIGIDKEVKLREGTVALRVDPLLGSGSTINFANLGNGKEIDEKTLIPGKVAAPSFLESAGYGDEQKKKVQTIIDDAGDMMAKAKDFVGGVDAKRTEWIARIDSIIAKGDTMATDARDVVADFKRDYPTVKERIVTAFDEAKLTMSDAGKLVNENRPTLQEAIKNFDDVGARLKDVTIAKVEELVTDARTKTNSALDTANSLLTKGDTLIAEEAPVIRSAMAKLRLSADQLAATIAEVRRSPWRLVYRPDKHDLEFELLYDSARTYAQSVADLSTAADSLKGIAAANGGTLPDSAKKNVADVVNQLNSAFEKYEQAEKAFLEQVKKQAK